jgi:hypothetical protein
VDYTLKGLLSDRILSEFPILKSDEVDFFDLQDIEFKDNTVSIISSTETLTIVNQDNGLSFYDTSKNELKPTVQESEDSTVITFTNSLYKDYRLTAKGNTITVNQKGVVFHLRGMQNAFALVGINEDVIGGIVKADSIGFEGQERLGSARGYIWSRIIPMLKDTLLLGHGPDTFVIEFPQNDYIGKIRAYGTSQMIVDKPHNMYLQIAVSTGVLSLLAALVLWGFYIMQSIKLYIKDIEKNFISITGACIFMAICAYLAAGLFNDSTVAIAPLFWVLLGLGFACNKMMSTQRAKAEKMK